MALLKAVKTWWENHENSVPVNINKEILHININDEAKWLKKKILVNGSEVEFILDSRAQISCISEETWKYIGSPDLSEVNFKGKNFNGTEIQILDNFLALIEIRVATGPGFLKKPGPGIVRSTGTGFPVPVFSKKPGNPVPVPVGTGSRCNSN
jgi:hypothetical protein